MTQRERIEANCNLSGSHNRDLETIVLSAADAYDQAVEEGQLGADRLGTIVDSACHTRTLVWSTGVLLLELAAEKWPDAGRAIRTMMLSSKAQVRFNAVCSLGASTPADILDQVIRSGLGDKSAKVRWKAADVADELGCKHLIPFVEAALRFETNERTKTSIAFSLGFLRDGYIINPQPDHSINISIKLFRGKLLGGGTVISVSSDEFRSKGIDAIVAEVRQRHDGSV